ncbi:phosphate:acyl-(acyl carrier protein) acyltransferase [Spongiibacter sp. IMCC21906]|nr:phosphate:acyl-(acyl carrier protein) acyltransferase [Spongiibacter sp. IMCC21906]
MGGDFGLRSSIPASLAALSENPSLHLSLVGDQDAIAATLSGKRYDSSRLAIVHSQSIVTMDEKPSVAVRKKRDSSMALSLELLRDHKASAVVSAGNTGALVAMGCIMIERLSGIHRPAICAPIPSRAGHTYMLDLGANIECDAQELYQFAVMGSALVSILDNKPSPRIAVLNIGEELQKGKDYLREAAELIQNDQSLNYVGFVEGGDVLGDAADVIVCEGFVGNVAIKVCEGTAKFIGEGLVAQFKQTTYGRLVGMAAKPLLRSFRQQINPERYNGAALLGLKGVVVKSHGRSGVSSFQNAIRHAVQACELNLPKQIEAQLQAVAKK